MDEYQNINAAQFKLIELLSRENPEGLFVVGDDAQSIYAFRYTIRNFRLIRTEKLIAYLFFRSRRVALVGRYLDELDQPVVVRITGLPLAFENAEGVGLLVGDQDVAGSVVLDLVLPQVGSAGSGFYIIKPGIVGYSFPDSKRSLTMVTT